MNKSIFFILVIQWIYLSARALVVPITAANPTKSLEGVSIPRVILEGNGGEAESAVVDIGNELANKSSDGKTMLVFGTHAGDFNTIEYLQKIRFSYDKLQTEGGIDRILMVINGEPEQIRLLTSLLDPPFRSLINCDLINCV